MWKLKVFELFTTLLPEAFGFVYFYYILFDLKFSKKYYILLSIIFSVAVFFVRLLPISFGIHTFIMLALVAFVTVKWGKVDIFSALLLGIIPFATVYLCEWVSFLILGIANFNMDLLNDATVRAFTSKISLGILIIIEIVVCYIKYRVIKRKENQHVSF